MYARVLLLRNCGRYTMVRSDLGSDYMTSRFLSEESMYAGLTREVTRQFGRIKPKMESVFSKAYDIPSKPIWFTPGIFVDDAFHVQDVVALDRMKYNVIDEAIPSTNKSTVYDKNGVRSIKDRNHTATFGSIESVLPGQYVFTIGISPHQELLRAYREQDVYLMGKKRSMFEVMGCSDITTLQEDEMEHTVPVQVQMGQLDTFHSYTIHEVNARYFLVEGRPIKTWRIDVEVAGQAITRYLPDLFVQKAQTLFG